MEPTPGSPADLDRPQPARPGRRSWRRRALLALLGLAALYPLYLGAAYLFLNTQLGPWALNLRPKRLTVHWSEARSLYPGDIRVRGLKVRGDASRARWSLEVDEGRGWIDLPALFGRRFRVVDFEGSGVRSVTLRKPPQPPRADAKGGRGPRRRGWILAFERVRLHHVREIVLDRLHLLGDSEVRGSFHSQIGDKLRLERTVLESRGARLLAGSSTLARDLGIVTVAAISPYAPRQHGGVQGFDFVSGTLDARGVTEGARAKGRLSLRLRLEQGLLQPGTDLRWITPERLPAGPELPPQLGFLRLEVVSGAPGASGAAGGALQLRANLNELTIGGGGDRPPLFAARDLILQSATAETRLSKLFAVARQLRRGEAPADGAWMANVEAGPIDLASLGLRRSWSLHLDRAAGLLSLPALARREIAISGLRGDGASGRIELVERPGPLPAPSARPWALRFVDAQVKGIRDFAFNDFTLRGESSLQGDFVRDGQGRVALAGARAEVARGEIAHRGKPLARDLALTATLDLPSVVPAEHPGLTILDMASASLSGSGKALGGAARGTAPEALNLDLRLEKGALAEGTQLALTLPRLPSSEFATFVKPLFLAGTVSEGRLNVSAEARGLTLGARPGRPPLLRAKRATLTTSTPELRLAKLLPRPGRAKAVGAAALPPGLLGDLSAEALELGGVTAHGRWSATADRAGARIDLSALREKQLELSEVTATGVELRLDPLPKGSPRPMPPASAWSIAAGGVRLMQIRSVASGTDRILGAAEASGGLTFDPRRRLALHNVLLSLPSGQVESGGEVVARDLALRAEIDLAAATGDPARGLAFLRQVSGAVRGKGKVTSLGFLRRYLKASWLEVEGQGELDADLRLAEGRLLTGSRVSLEQGLLQASFLDSVAKGEARLVAGVDASRGRPAVHVRAIFKQFTVEAARAEASIPYIRGQGLAIDVTSADLDLASPVSDLKASVDLPRAEVPDLRTYNAYLPEGAGVEILGGSGGIDLHLDFDGATDTARGKVRLNSSDLRVRFQELELGGNLKLEAPLASRNLKGREFALDGARLDLDQVSYREPDAAADSGPPSWWAHMRLSGGMMTWGRPLTLRSRAEVQMKDSGLLLNLVAQRKSFLHWFENVLHVEDVTARGELAFGDGAIVIDPLRVLGGKLDLRSRFRFSREHKTGDLYVRWGKLATGIALRDGKRDFKILAPEAWFERREGWGAKIR